MRQIFRVPENAFKRMSLEGSIEDVDISEDSGRIELTALAVGRYGLASKDVATLIDKHPSSMARWLKLGIQLQQTDPVFKKPINALDQKISSAARSNAKMRRMAPLIAP